jgi:DNA-binding beta-propeller fold protein YncE
MQLSGNCLGRHFLRSRLITLLRTVITAALETVSRPATCSLTELTVGGKQTVLVLQLLQASESFAKQYLGSAVLLGDSPHSNTYALCAILLSFAAVENWTADTLDKFITGNLGTVSTAPAYVKSLLDSAANSIRLLDTPLHSQRSTSAALAEYRFSFDGFAAHELFLAQQISAQLDSSILFRALQQKFGLCASHATLELLRLVSFKQMLQLLAASEIISTVSALLPLILPTHFSFPRGAAAQRSTSSAVGANASAVAAAVVADILNIDPLADTRLRAARFNQSRSVQAIPFDCQAARVSVDAQGCMYVCGTNCKAIRVLDGQGTMKFDLRITQNAVEVPVHNLRATAHDPSSGNIYVSDCDAATIYCIDRRGELLFTSPVGAVTKPLGLAFCSRTQRVAVADSSCVRVLRAGDLTPIKTLSRLTASGSMPSPSMVEDSDLKSCGDVCFDAHGFLYAVDGGVNRVGVYDCSYVNVTTFGSCGSGVGQFNSAQGVCIDGTGKVFVSDSTRVQMFDRQGRHVVSVQLESLDTTLRWSQLGGMSVDNTGRLLVCSQGTGSLLRIM